MNLDFTGKTVLVTGASRGIGRTIALEFGRAGASVGCLATTLGGAQATADLIREAGGTASAAAANLAEAAEVEAALSALEAELGTPWALVNNAGITRDKLMMRMSEDDFDQVLAVNLKGAWLTSRAVMKPMMKARGGRIINISSVIGLHGGAGQANYSASKAGLIGLTMSLAKELGSRGITCNAVAPGFIETDMTGDLPQDFREFVVKQAPAGRLGRPEDIAPAVLFLASEQAAFITGQTLTVDGGLFL
ncbi:MAG: 3-oxoacyl-[acyl-carrier-protein] reductase [Fimbriimonadaceae bacterium]|nr:3-oxoacyl-[acyl-carrier-protein] reductase [Fimbriimonadaceae bacterium]